MSSWQSWNDENDLEEDQIVTSNKLSWARIAERCACRSDNSEWGATIRHFQYERLNQFNDERNQFN